MKSPSVFGVFAAASFAFLTSSAHAAWYITDLNLPIFSSSGAYDINDNGQITGGVSQGPGGSPFLYDNGALTLLDPSNITYGAGVSINDSGQIVGRTQSYGGYLYSNGSFTPLPGLSGTDNAPYSINNLGQVVGSSGTSPYLYQNGSIQSIGGISGAWRGTASSINDNGVIVGYSEMQGGGTSSFIYSNGQLTDIGKLGTADTYANAVNNAGQIVGYAFLNPGTAQSVPHAFTYNNGQMTDLGTNFSLGSYAQDINNRGQIIGTNELPGDQVTSWLYSAGSFIDLGSLPEVVAAGWKDLQAFAINNNGDIVGEGITNTGFHAFVLSPNHPFASSTLVALGGHVAPEIDGDNAMLGIALLGGLLAFMRPKKSA
jgi:probable HAF family extracellular repeat protein